MLYEKIFLMFCYLILVIAIIVVLINEWRKYRLRKQEEYRLEMQNNLMTQYYSVFSGQLELMKKFRHDIANHLLVLEELEQRGMNQELMEYKQQLTERYNQLKQVGYCDDQIVDALIHQKKTECDENHIQLETKLIPFSRGNIAEGDMFIILYTVLSVIAEVVKEQDNANKRIRIESKNATGNLWFWIEYSLSETDMAKKHYRPKREQKRIGYIKEILDKYDGQVQEMKRGELFCIEIRLHSA